MFTDADTIWANGPAALDQYNRRLEKALSAYDRTQDAKINYVYELPIGPGKHFLSRGILSQVIGGWRVGATQRYASGVPLAFSGTFGFPSGTIGNRPYVTTYDNWRTPTKGDKFDPSVDRYFKTPTTANWNGDVAIITTQGFFPLQPRNQIGNMTRNNPKMRDFPVFNENVSLAKTFTLSRERRETVDVRIEGFNVLNRTRFGTPNTNLSDAANLGLVRTQANAPRAMQFAVKMKW